MIELKTKLRKWGNSLGIVVPHGRAESERMREGEEITVLLIKSGNVLKETFGTFKFKKSTQKMMDEIDAELYNE